MGYESVAILTNQQWPSPQPLTHFAIARAIEELDPGAVKIGARGEMVGPNGPILGGVMDELAATARIPSAVIRAPFAPPRFAPGELPATLRRYYSLTDLVPHLGQLQVDTLRELRGLWVERMKGLASAEEITRAVACLDAGLLVFPVKGETMAATYAHLVDSLPSLDAERRLAWDKAADLFRPVVDAWASGLMAEAKTRAAQLRRSEAAWDLAHAVTRTIAEAPAVIAQGAATVASEAVGGVAKGLGPIWSIVALLGLLGGVALALGLRPLRSRKASA